MREQPGPIAILSRALVVVLVASLACSPFTGGLLGPGPTGTAEPDAEPSNGSATTDLRCEREGYPCSYSEADPASLQRSVELMDQAEQLYLQQGSMIEAGDRLRQEHDVAEIAFDRTGLWIRVEGAPPMWLWDYDDIPRSETADTVSSRGSRMASPVREASGPIGPQPPGQEPEKRALLLSPWAWHLGDDTSAIGSILSGHRNYDCPNCIERRVATADPRESEDEGKTVGPPLDWFKDWSNYDLIYVVSHGRQWCGTPHPEHGGFYKENKPREEGDCVGVLTTGRWRRSVLDQPETLTSRGVAWGHKPGEDWWHQGLTPDFFTYTALEDGLIFFNSCQLLRNNSFPQVVAGTNTAVLGWTESVKIGRGEATAKAFFENLVQGGLRAQKAHELTLDAAGYNIEDTYAGAELRLAGDQEPRGVEVITFLHPVSHSEVMSGDVFPVEGIAADGEPDRLSFLVQVDGIDETQNPEAFTIHFRVDDQEVSETYQLTRKVGQYSYQARGAFPLPFDGGERDRIKLEGWVELQEGGVSRNVVEDVELAACGWSGTMTGSRTGTIKGPEIINTHDVANLDPAQLQELIEDESLGPLGPGAGLPPDLDPERLAQTPLALVMSGEAGFPILTVSEEGMAHIIFEPASPLSYGDRSAQLNLTVNTGDRLEGTLDAVLTNPMLGESIGFQGSFVWEAQSYCGFGTKLQALQNTLQGEAPSLDGGGTDN